MFREFSIRLKRKLCHKRDAVEEPVCLSLTFLVKAIMTEAQFPNHITNKNYAVAGYTSIVSILRGNVFTLVSISSIRLKLARAIKNKIKSI